MYETLRTLLKLCVCMTSIMAKTAIHYIYIYIYILYIYTVMYYA